MPLIALTPSWNSQTKQLCLGNDYIDAVQRAGGAPVLLSMTDSEAIADEMLSRMDGVLFTGGGDVNPACYGEEILPCCGEPTDNRDRFETLLLRCALRRKLPILGICRGLQIINVCLGGSLYQDIEKQYSRDLSHPRYDVPRDYAHAVSLMPGTLLHQLYGSDEIQVNSRHHQGIKVLAPGLKINAVAPDRLIEGVESADGSPLLTVQWHPESLQDRYSEHRAPFDWLIREASR